MYKKVTHNNNMKVYLCDNEDLINKIKFNKNDIILYDDKNIKSCRGCFSCWTKHPMECCYKNDNISNLCKDIILADEIIIITKINNGCYSHKVKKILERIIGVVEPFFTIRQKEIHHKLRRQRKFKFKVYVYGKVTKLEKKVFEALCKRNQINLNCENVNIMYFEEKKEVEEVLLIDSVC